MGYTSASGALNSSLAASSADICYTGCAAAVATSCQDAIAYRNITLGVSRLEASFATRTQLEVQGPP